MKYKLEELEDQIIATLKASEETQGIYINTHVGEVNERVLQFPEYQEGFVKLLPFILLQYQGRRTQWNDNLATVYAHTLRFRLYVGAKSLRQKQEAKHAAYAILRTQYDVLHGRWFNSAQTLADNLQRLEGDAIVDTDFRQLSPLVEIEGEDERLIVNLPSIIVYSADWEVTVLA